MLLAVIILLRTGFPAAVFPPTTGLAVLLQGTRLPVLSHSAMARHLEDKTGTATDQPVDFSVAIRTFREGQLRDSLSMLEPQTA
jgi:hypothetical protein